MVVTERLSPPINESPKQVSRRMVNDTERRVFSFLRKRLNATIPGSELHYECTRFRVEDDNGFASGTVPDMHIVKPNGREIFLEVTTAGKSKKSKQRKVMNNIPDVKYVVWGKQELEAVEKAIGREKPGFRLIHSPHASQHK